MKINMNRSYHDEALCGWSNPLNHQSWLIPPETFLSGKSVIRTVKPMNVSHACFQTRPSKIISGPNFLGGINYVSTT